MEDIDADNRYSNIGIVEFKDKFDEIMEYFRKQMKPEKQKYYEMEIVFFLGIKEAIFLFKKLEIL